MLPSSEPQKDANLYIVGWARLETAATYSTLKSLVRSEYHSAMLATTTSAPMTRAAL